jgi:NTE family protein
LSQEDELVRKIGVALGGGGARGLAHIVMLGVLDDFGIKPHAMAGTSIGAVIGVLYAGGLSAAQIREEIKNLTALPESFEKAFKEKRLFGWLDFIDLEFGRSSMLKIDKFLDQVEEAIGVSRLEDLTIPLKVVATDFWGHNEVVLDSGPIEEAVAASFAIPGIFKPIVKNGRVLVDGGMVNPVPYDLLQDDCDIVIAIDVITPRRRKGKLIPSYTDTIFSTFQIAEKTIVRQKMRHRPPTIYIEPQIDDVLALEFHKASKIYAQSETARRQLEKALRDALG